MNVRSLVGWVFVSVWLLVLPAWAVEYRLQVTNLDYHTFFAYLENSSPAWRGEESMGRLEARLDAMEFPAGAVIPGREVKLLEGPGYGGRPILALPLPVKKGESWTTLVWLGDPGDTIAFLVKTEMQAWQEVRAVATNAEGTLRRVSIGGPSLFGRAWQQVPEVMYDFIANAVDRGTFPQWVAQNAKATNGMSVVVGRSDPTYRPERVYTLLKLPPEPRTFKLVIGWKDHDAERNSGQNGREIPR
ncbi:MAG: hypothetical protein ACREOH_18540 [Candidatus Entotheonellia bacterium]